MMAKTRQPTRMTVLIFLSALSVLPVNMILPSLPAISDALRADYALISLSVACYAIATALVELIAGTLSDRFGRKPVILASVILFTIASVGCALATNLATFLICRAMQAAIATCFSVVLVIVKEDYGVHSATSKIGYLQAGWALAPMLGPSLGGVLDDVFGWQASFVLLALLGLVALIVTVWDIKPGTPQPTIATQSLWVPYRRLLSTARFWGYALCMALSTGTLYIFLTGAPLVAGALVNGSSTWLGVYMGLTPVGFIAGSFMVGRFSAQLQPNRLLILGRLLTCIGLGLGLILTWLLPGQALAFFGPCLSIGLGNGLTMPAANTKILFIDNDLAGTAAGLAAATSIGGGALVVGIATLGLTQSTTTVGLIGLLFASAVLALLTGIGAVKIDEKLY